MKFPKRLASFAFAVTLSLSTLFGATVSGAQAQQVEFTNFERGTQSGIHSKEQVIVDQQAGYDDLWSKHRGWILNPSDKKPFVDFKKEMLVGVFSGSKGSSGYSVNIDRIEVENDLLVVTYTEHAQQGGIFLTVITYPYQIVRTAKSDLPVVFRNSAAKAVAQATAQNVRFSVTFNYEVTREEIQEALDGKGSIISMTPTSGANNSFSIELSTKMKTDALANALRKLPQVDNKSVAQTVWNNYKYTVRFTKKMSPNEAQMLIAGNGQVVSMKSLDIDGGDPNLFFLELNSSLSASEMGDFLRGLSQVDPTSVYKR